MDKCRVGRIREIDSQPQVLITAVRTHRPLGAYLQRARSSRPSNSRSILLQTTAPPFTPIRTFPPQSSHIWSNQTINPSTKPPSPQSPLFLSSLCYPCVLCVSPLFPPSPNKFACQPTQKPAIIWARCNSSAREPLRRRLGLLEPDAEGANCPEPLRQMDRWSDTPSLESEGFRSNRLNAETKQPSTEGAKPRRTSCSQAVSLR
jgi:hypothetical protein